jgi:hypothetical protein
MNWHNRQLVTHVQEHAGRLHRRSQLQARAGGASLHLIGDSVLMNLLIAESLRIIVPA